MADCTGCFYQFIDYFHIQISGIYGENLNLLFHAHRKVPEIALPIGISFFTFQAISYVIDVYRGRGEAQRNLLNVGLYISFFPQLIAGPIVRYADVAGQIDARSFDAADAFYGATRFCIGLAKKADVILPGDNIIEKFDQHPGMDVIIADECQFFTPEQIDQLRTLVDERNMPVICFGLRTDFLTHLFPGSRRIFYFDESITEI